jgi:hypothetical protein
MYQNATIIISKNRENGNIPIEINKELDKDALYHRYSLIFTLTKSLKIACK